MVAAKICVGIIGLGNISPAYIEGCRAFDVLELVAGADMDGEKAQAVGAKHNLPILSVDDLIAHPDLHIIINLTIPAVHADVSLRIIAAGKSVYSEKPLAISLDDGRRVLAAARERGVRVGCAPDTFLFGNHQTARHLLDAGAIGEPVAATAFMLGHGPEAWHPNPDFFYAPGGGPMLDMGPYYITSLVNLLGPVQRVAAFARASFPERIGREARRIPVHVPTHYAGTLEFASGALATLITSFDVWGHTLPRMEVYGSVGTLALPDPNTSREDVRLFVPNEREWEVMPRTHRPEWERGIGVADLAYSLLSGRAHRASGDLAYHALEVMFAFEQASASGQAVTLTSTVERPAPLPLDLPPRTLDA